MKRLLSVLTCLLVVAAAPALAQDKKAPSDAQKKQQERMAACNKQAGDKKLKGDERKKFIGRCRAQRKAEGSAGQDGRLQQTGQPEEHEGPGAPELHELLPEGVSAKGQAGSPTARAGRGSTAQVGRGLARQALERPHRRE